MARGRECYAHKHTHLVPLEVHHVWPLGYHGPNTPANRITGCANAHSDVHYLLADLLAGREPDLRTYSPGVRLVARRGHAAIIAYGESLSSRLIPTSKGA